MGVAMQEAVRGHMKLAAAGGTELEALELAIEHKAALQLQRDEAVRQMIGAKVALADQLARANDMQDDIDFLRLQVRNSS